MIGTILEVAGVALLVLGLTLATIGLYGLLRMPAVFDQLHAAGLVTGPAMLLILLAADRHGERGDHHQRRARLPVRADHRAALGPRDRSGGVPSPAAG